ncbi:hypothetical protein RvY_13597 [Ramazzottius varieornatus]|uniref:Ubiquitin-like protein ATG12 n=1 Tax=Ramazzottius varieornatus TaxID=947166 RepID=A0A1D1VQ84_RAMVA|nr:hypothetical protein RvY_13597 [Ramazzottius varieornatus]
MADQGDRDAVNEDQILGQGESTAVTAPTTEAANSSPSSDTSVLTTPQNFQAEPDTRTTASPAPQEESPAEKGKIDVLLKAVGDAPIMKKKKWAVEPNKKVAWIADFVRKYIKCEPHESLFLYVNQYFSPSPDQEIGSIYECFGSDGKLVLHYCKQQAWG